MTECAHARAVCNSFLTVRSHDDDGGGNDIIISDGMREIRTAVSRFLVGDQRPARSAAAQKYRWEISPMSKTRVFHNTRAMTTLYSEPKLRCTRRAVRVYLGNDVQSSA